jgi:SAM-dependent methyltransferase
MKQDKIWDYFQNDVHGRRAFDIALPRYRFVQQRLDPQGRILNIGVGTGGFETLMRQAGREIFSLDPSEAAVLALRERLKMDGEHARVGYSQAMPFEDATFDAVVMSEVLEHLDDATLASTMAEVRRVLKVGGRFVGTVPADESLADQTAVCPECGKVFHRWGHVRCFSEASLLTLLRQSFDCAHVRRVVFGTAGQLNWKGRIGWLLKRATVALGVKGSGESLFFRASR